MELRRRCASSIASSAPAAAAAAAAAAAPAAAAAAADAFPTASAHLDEAPEGVTVVRSIAHAREVARKLFQLKDRVHACDTEVADIDLKKVGPVGHGRVTCISVYSGDDVDFGSGPNLWIDTLDGDGTSGEAILNEFKEFFESEETKLVWHNYSFDRHVMYNHAVDCKGFAGDTMHMARLWNTALATKGGYSLANLSKLLELPHAKHSMKELFGAPVLKKDGTPGKLRQIPPIDEIQRSAELRADWIRYSTLDARATWLLHQDLRGRLARVPWAQGKCMDAFYDAYFVPFGSLLTDMEREGIFVESSHLAEVETRAKHDRIEKETSFRSWAMQVCVGAERMNISSDAQVRQLLFAPCQNSKKGKGRGRKGARAQQADEAAAAAAQLHGAAGGESNGSGGVELLRSIAADATELPRARIFTGENVEQWVDPATPDATPKKKRDFVISGLGLPASHFTAGGWPSVAGSVLNELAGQPFAEEPIFGSAKALFADEDEGVEACEAIASLCEVGSIDTMLANFILPLQEFSNADPRGRVHCSLNLNTETGRLSARRPNLQNQPALEKDRYKIRAAFTAEPGNMLVVCDYGQLELRLLAHISRCESMLEAFKLGGDFHSRTAVGMYPAIREAVDRGEVIIEHDGDGPPPAPLVKSVYASERRKAKTLNFSIAYGKTAHGLSKDWDVSLSEAQDTLERWYVCYIFIL
tara:strand:+ start:143 stop:2242 length:2100 start_codon:yes stop_codon:yes gene_type:complete